MAESILYGLTQEVLKNLGSATLNGIASAWGFKTQLNKLKNTTNTIKNVLLDAEEKQADSLAVRDWLERLSIVVYAADELLDEFNVVSARKELMGGSKLTKEVHTFFSHSNQVAFASKISWKIKKIREELDDIENDGKKFEFVLRSPVRGSAMSRRRDQTMSYVDADNIVGREDDKKAILKMLLEPSSTGHDEGLPVISIVGMGGMGKTTLAQLIYNDPQVEEHFDLRLWVCVSDVFDIKIIIDKLLKSATNNEAPNLEMDQLQGLWRKEVGDKKYLLVLDDVWNESREEWLKLSELLKIGSKGCKILVTTRSRKVAEIMGISRPYELQGLTKEKSWILFEKLAFKPGEAEQKPHLVKIGKEIVQKCGFVPLAIRTLGSLLYGEEERKWSSIRDTSLAKILDSQSDNKSGIMNILRLSYNHLWSPLKNCFAYCALFPKDYQFKKEMLINLWIAEGFVVLSPDDPSVDEAAEDYFHTLLQRGFFQDTERDSLEVIESCKMHDLMHDLAQEVAGVKCKIAKSNERSFDEKSVHLSLSYQLKPSWEIPDSMPNMKLLRTFLPLEQAKSDGFPQSKLICKKLVTRFRCLRVLDLHMSGLQSLPSSIGKLIHLRYLNLSYTPIKKLSDSITQLWNLQTLKLSWCDKLRTLPANMSKLINLRSLDVDGCGELSDMPSGLGELTLLISLPRFIIKGKDDDAANSRNKATPSAKLSDLKNLNKLRGTLKIEIKGRMANTMLEAQEAELSNKHQITKLIIKYPGRYGSHEAADCKHDEAVLEGLKPPSNIKSLRIDNYEGEYLPSWARMDNLCKILPNLVQITLDYWRRCQKLPTFSRLPFLKRLVLNYLKSVEYIESNDVFGVPSSSSSTSSIFFPSLEQLELKSMWNLKGWWKEVDEGTGNENDTSKSESESASNEVAAQIIPTTFMQFSKLSKLTILYCPNLRMLPLCPNVEDLSLLSTNERFSVLKIAASAPLSSSAPCSLTTWSGLKLKKLVIDNAEDLVSLPSHCLHQLSSLHVRWDGKLQNTERLGDVFATLSSSLRSLTFFDCNNLRSIAKGLENLTKLETLRLYWCRNLEVLGDEEGMPWKAFNTTLHSLTLENLEQVGLPKGLQHLANLRSLSLIINDNLKEIPEWISCLSSLEYLQLKDCLELTSLPEAFRQLTNLKHLEIIGCPKLKERCQEGRNGSEWSKIQHIPIISVREGGDW